MYYIDDSHKKRFHALMDHAILPIKSGTYAYQAAIYLLTSSDLLWSAAQDHIDKERVNFSDVNRRGFRPQEYMSLLYARDCMCDTDYLRVQDLSDKQMVDERLFRLFMQAVYIKRYSINQILYN